MILTYRYKLRSTRAQYALLAKLCEDQRQLYNAALQERIEAWSKRRTSISRIDQFKSLTEIRSFDPTYAAIPVSLSRWSLARVEDAFTGFFSRIKRGEKAGFPRFRSKSRWSSFGFVEWSGITLKGNRLFFKPFDIGLKLHLHRDMPVGASIKSSSFTKVGRHWYVALAADVPVTSTHTAPDAAIGLDVGVTHLLTTSDGAQIENPRPRSKREADLRGAQRALARCKRGSRRRQKVRERLASLQRSIARARSTYLHEVTAGLSERYGLIAVEKLKTKGMTRSAKGTAERPGKQVRQKAGLNRAILDVSPARLIALLSYKAERAGGIVVKVDPRNTSQDCSSCGERVVKTLADRRHVCACGADLDRDHNAALNILHRGLEAHRRAMPPEGVNVGHQSVRRLEILPDQAA